jgi:hypothetical protein
LKAPHKEGEISTNKEIGPKSEKEERPLKGAKEGFKEGTPKMVLAQQISESTSSVAGSWRKTGVQLQKTV